MSWLNDCRHGLHCSSWEDGEKGRSGQQFRTGGFDRIGRKAETVRIRAMGLRSACGKLAYGLMTTTTPPASPPPDQGCLQVQHGSSRSAHDRVHGVRVPENRTEHHPTTVRALEQSCRLSSCEALNYDDCTLPLIACVEPEVYMCRCAER